jgi:hypothetical protein
VKFNVTNAGTTSPSISVSDPGNKFHDSNWTVYASGTLGAGATLELQISPDPDPTFDEHGLTDANSRWFTGSTLNFSTVSGTSYSTFNARFRKARATIVGTQAGDNVTLEVV